MIIAQVGERRLRRCGGSMVEKEITVEWICSECRKPIKFKDVRFFNETFKTFLGHERCLIIKPIQKTDEDPNHYFTNCLKCHKLAPYYDPRDKTWNCVYCGFDWPDLKGG